jgi:ubiquinone/menaquinone biosynthesis C-methylase UbiE
MTCANVFKRMFKGVSLEIEDLYLLEAFQIAYFPGGVPERELAVVLWAYPAIQHYLTKRCPSILGFLERVLKEHEPAEDKGELAACGEELVWSMADWLVYNKCPEAYDRLEFHRWDFREITSITGLEGKRVVDGGSGTGRVALEAALTAKQVYAVEPVARLRRFIRKEAIEAGLENLFVIDGFLHTIPLPDSSADILITSHALGWSLEDELAEFERVVRQGGHIIHCPGTAECAAEEDTHRRLVSAEWGYAHARYREADGWKRKYWKERR